MSSKIIVTDEFIGAIEWRLEGVRREAAKLRIQSKGDQPSFEGFAKMKGLIPLVSDLSNVKSGLARARGQELTLKDIWAVSFESSRSYSPFNAGREVIRVAKRMGCFFGQ